MLEMLSVAVPLFARLTVIPALVVPTGWFPKAREVGERTAPACVPVPLTGTDCGEPGAVSVNTTFDDLVPIAVGLKVTFTVQICAGVSVVTQVLLLSEKSPEVVTEEIVRFIEPLFVTVIVWAALECPTTVDGKLREAGEKAICPVPTPVPVKGTVWGLPGASSVNDRLALNAKADKGVKVTETVQVDDAARVVLQVFDEIAKLLAFVPVIAIELMFSVALPVFVSVVVMGAEVVFNVWLPKAREDGEKPVPACVPFPVKATFCGLAGALSVKVRFATRAPVVAGVNVTLTTHEALTARVPPQVSAEMAKSAAFVPVSVIEERVSGAPPGFETVTDKAEEVTLTVWLPKARFVGLKPIAATPEPVPLSGTVWGLAGALSATETLAERAPATCGLNVTLIVQVPAGATVPQLFACENEVALVPVIVTLEMIRLPEPVLVTVTACGDELVPTVWAAKVRLVGAKLIPGAEVVPVQVSPTVCGEPAALSETFIRAENEAAERGVQVTVIVQLPPANTDVPQLLDWAKSAGFVPVIVMLFIFSRALPVLESVTNDEGLVLPTSTLPKATDDGDRLIPGVPAPHALTPFVTRMCG
jgi:hypothetical protein